nr:hypothetical protein [Burkholderiales bacterium]
MLDTRNFAVSSLLLSVTFVAAWRALRFATIFLMLGMLFTGKQLLQGTVK